MIQSLMDSDLQLIYITQDQIQVLTKRHFVPVEKSQCQKEIHDIETLCPQEIAGGIPPDLFGALFKDCNCFKFQCLSGIDTVGLCKVNLLTVSLCLSLYTSPMKSRFLALCAI